LGEIANLLENVLIRNERHGRHEPLFSIDRQFAKVAVKVSPPALPITVFLFVLSFPAAVGTISLSGKRNIFAGNPRGCHAASNIKRYDLKTICPKEDGLSRCATARPGLFVFL